MSRAEVAAFLREFVDELEGEASTVATGVERGDRRDDDAGRRTEADTAGRSGADADRTAGAGERREASAPGEARQVTFVVGGDSATVTIPETVEFDVEVESRSPLLKSGVSQEVEFQLSWEIEEEPEDDTIDLK